MGRYVARRLLLTIPVLLGASFLIFAMVYALPGDPIRALAGERPLSPARTEPLARLMIAQDTGSAIVGPARGDYYFGSGEAAGARAGLLRHTTGFVVLRPRSAQTP